LKGIVLAAGKGTRMYPMTKPISKPLLPIYDKPNIYYSLSTLIFAGISDILIVVPVGMTHEFEALLGNGENYGVNISFIEQKVQRGIADAFILGRDFIGDDSVCLMLGDNIFYGPGFDIDMEYVRAVEEGAVVFGYYVEDPRPYGVIEFDKKGTAISLEEKPAKPKSHYIVPGLYFYDNEVVKYAADLKPSARGELEITDINRIYMELGKLHVIPLGRDFRWFDTGNAESMFKASEEIRRIQYEKNKIICCPEEQAYKKGYIDNDTLKRISEEMKMTKYGQYLGTLVK